MPAPWRLCSYLAIVAARLRLVLPVRAHVLVICEASFRPTIFFGASSHFGNILQREFGAIGVVVVATAVHRRGTQRGVYRICITQLTTCGRFGVIRVLLTH